MTCCFLQLCKTEAPDGQKKGITVFRAMHQCNGRTSMQTSEQNLRHSCFDHIGSIARGEHGQMMFQTVALKCPIVFLKRLCFVLYSLACNEVRPLHWCNTRNPVMLFFCPSGASVFHIWRKQHVSTPVADTSAKLSLTVTYAHMFPAGSSARQHRKQTRQV